MNDSQWLRRSLEKALAFAHAAVEDASPYRIIEAKSYAHEVLPRLARLVAPSLSRSEGRRLLVLVSQLRALLYVLDRQLNPAPLACTN
jgi:hypothetical protein